MGVEKLWGKIMKALMEWHEDIVIVSISGLLDFEKVYEFRKKSLRHFMQNKVIFSLKELSFVGSTGLSSFAETLNKIALENPNGLGVCDVSFEYEKLLDPFVNEKLKIFKTLDVAKNHYALKSMDFG